MSAHASATGPAQGSGGPREFPFDGADFQAIATMLYADSGIFLAEQKAPLVYGRLVKRLRALGIASFKDYCSLIADARGVDERQHMLSALTTNVTAFFRERHHFEHLKTTELPPLLRQAAKGGRVRLWSAGCSKGHEPYSMAMTLLGLTRDVAKLDVRILATDIDPVVVDTGRRGLYAADDLADVPKADLDRCFRTDGADGLEVGQQMRALVAFRELNLMAAWPMKGRFQVIFCRNVAIYFDEATQANLWSRFASVLTPGGLLCIGHSERLSGEAQHRFEPAGTTMYRLLPGAAR